MHKPRSQSTKSIATNGPSDGVVHAAQFPNKPSMATRTFTGQVQDQKQSGSYSLRQYIENIENDELETVNSNGKGAYT